MHEISNSCASIAKRKASELEKSISYKNFSAGRTFARLIVWLSWARTGLTVRQNAISVIARDRDMLAEQDKRNKYGMKFAAIL